MKLSIGNRSDVNTGRRAYLQAWISNRAERSEMRRQTLGRNEAYNPLPNRFSLQGMGSAACLQHVHMDQKSTRNERYAFRLDAKGAT
jgi:hypothetical protein